MMLHCIVVVMHVTDASGHLGQGKAITYPTPRYSKADSKVGKADSKADSKAVVRIMLVSCALYDSLL